jgi:hypothetical protein
MEGWIMKKENMYKHDQVFRAMPSIYCYAFPETYEVMDSVQKRINREMFKVTGSPTKVNKSLEGLFYEEMEIPSTNMNFTRHTYYGNDLRDFPVVNLDEVAKIMMDKIRAKYSEMIYPLDDFPYAYTTMGSSPAIFKLLAKYRTDGIKDLHVERGEYAGYGAYAETLGMTVHEHDMLPHDKKYEGIWFISNPSATDGNIINNKRLIDMAVKGNQIVLDLSYAGMTRPYTYEVYLDSFKAVVLSMSKPFGVFRFRMGGFVFSREEIPSLYGNKWFNDTTRMLQAWKLLEKFGFHKLYQKYKPYQDRIIKGINETFYTDVRTSDVFLMAWHYLNSNIEGSSKQFIRKFKREHNYRFCLTPYFEYLETLYEDELEAYLKS